MSNLKADGLNPCFHVPVVTVLFYLDKKDKILKTLTEGNKKYKTKISYASWGPHFDEVVCSQIVCAYAQFRSVMSNTEKIP